MAHTIDFAHCIDSDDALDVPLAPADPFTALRFHFGMLLGVGDFEAQQAYHRGKMRLHNAWLHGPGVIWGFKVSVDRSRREVRVCPGLALSAAGHELHLDAPACVDVGAWFEKHQKDGAVQAAVRDLPNGAKGLKMHVVALFRPCLTREVPALAEPCEGSNTDTAFSRVAETIELELRPGHPDPTGGLTFERVRILLGLLAPRIENGAVLPAHQEVVDERRRLAALAPPERQSARAAALHRFAVLDTIDMKPGVDADGDRLRFPANEQTPVVLATIDEMELQLQGDAWTLLNSPAVSMSTRATLLPTGLLQELLGAFAQAPADAGGPRLTMPRPTASAITLVSDKPLSTPTVTNGQPFSVTSRTPATAGWTVHQVTATVVDKTTITLTLGGGATLAMGELVRVVARGTGPAPILGEDGIPLAGGMADPPSGGHDGRDFVAMQTRS